MKAVKGNKEYLIDESQKKGYQDRGYDIIDDNGVLSAHGRGKTVPYDKYEETLRENNTLKKQIAAMSAESTPKDGSQESENPPKEKVSGKSKIQG